MRHGLSRWLSRWYAKLHRPAATANLTSSTQRNTQGSAQGNAQNHTQAVRQPPVSPPPTLNLSIFFRIWLAVAVIIVVSAVLVFFQLFDHIKPTSQQVIEDTLVDTSKLLATSLQPELVTGRIYHPQFQQQLDTAFANHDHPLDNRRYQPTSKLNQLSTWYHHKTHSSFRLYVTDATGLVIYDSLPAADNAEGQDYSQWNDVYLTLRGQYGARSTRSDAKNPDTSVMYVAQPIKDVQGRLLGVVSVGKPVASILPYVQATRQRMLTTVAMITLLSLLLAGLVAWWLQQSIAMLTRYTQALAADTAKPRFYLGRELNQLADSIEQMTQQIENKAYVTEYVHTLTHELKSPLTAIRASGELLADSDMDRDDRQMLSDTITSQSDRLQALIERLLLLAKIEQPSFRLNLQPLNLLELLKQLVSENTPTLHARGLRLDIEFDIELEVDTHSTGIGSDWQLWADKFWLHQALQNILDNAMNFAQRRIIISIAMLTTAANTAAIHSSHHDTQLQLEVFNDGDPIPEFAVSKVFERYFSLSHNHNYNNNHSHSHSQHHCNHKPSQPYPRMGNTSMSKSTGLGLTLVKQIIELHGGTVHIANCSNYADPTKQDKKDQLNGVLVQIRIPITQVL